MATISVIVEEGETRTGTLRGGVLSPEGKIKEIEVDTLKKSLSDLSGNISEVLKEVKSVGDFKLKEVEIGVEISAEGGFALVGCAKAGAKGAIKLKFSA
jgi:hypothetical protein